MLHWGRLTTYVECPHLKFLSNPDTREQPTGTTAWAVADLEVVMLKQELKERYNESQPEAKSLL
jgi:hypothetical protein